MAVKVVNHNANFEMSFATGTMWVVTPVSGGLQLDVYPERTGSGTLAPLGTFAPGAWTHVTTGE